MNEKTEEKRTVPFNEDVYREAFLLSGREYPEKEIDEKLKDEHAANLHERVKKELEVSSRTYELSTKYTMNDKRLSRIFIYYLKDEKDNPENAEYNRRFVEELNTPEGAQHFVNERVKEFMQQDISELIPTNMEDMTEKYLENPAKYETLWTVVDLLNGDNSAGDEVLYHIDSEVAKVLKEKREMLQSGIAFKNAAHMMAQDSWAVMDNPAVDALLTMEDLTGGLAIKYAEAVSAGGKNSPLAVELHELTDNMNISLAYKDVKNLNAMNEKGLLKDGQVFYLDGNEQRRTDILRNGRIDEVQTTPIENYNNIMRRVDEQTALSDYFNQMKKSQKAIWGNGSPEFRDLMDAIEEYQDACSKDPKLGFNNTKVNQTFKDLMDKADAYLKIKEGKSLNTNGKIRYEMVKGLREELTNLSKNRFHDILNSEFKVDKIKTLSDEELKKKSEEPENKRLHEQAKEYFSKNNNKELKYKEFKEGYPSKNNPNMDNRLDRFYYYFFDRSGTPAAKEYNDKFFASLNTQEGQQQLVNKAIKTVLQIPNEFLLPKTLQEAAGNYMKYPELCDMAWAIHEAYNGIAGKDSPFKIDESIKNALVDKMAFIQGTEVMQQSVNTMAREDWAHFDVEIPDEMTNFMLSASLSSDKGLRNDPLQVNFGDGKHTISEPAMLIASRYEINKLVVGRQQLENGSKMFETGAELTVKGKKVNTEDALKLANANKEKGLDAMDGIEVSYDEKAAAELNAKINQLDTGMARMSTPQDKQLEAAKQAEEAAKKAEEPAKKAEEAPKAAERPAVDPAKIEAAKAGFSKEENEKYEKDRRFMQSRANLLPNGPEKLVSEMAIAAKDSLFEHVGRHRIYTRSTIDMKIMTFQRLLTQDIKFGEGKIAQAMEARGITTPKQAEAFIDAFNMGPAMKNFENTVMIHRTGEGQIAVTDDCKAQMKAFAVGDGAADIAHQCTQSIKAVNKAMADKRYQEALAKNKGLEKAADKLPGGPGIGK